MQFDVYGRFQLDIERVGDAWVVFRRGNGTRVRSHDVVIPSAVEEADVAEFLDDLFHELSGPDDKVKLVVG